MNVLQSALNPPRRARRLAARRERWRRLLFEPLEQRYLLAAVPSATLLATSEPFTTDANVAIGEVLRYRLQVGIPEGTSVNLQLVDLLPSGLQFLNDSTAKVALVADTPTNISSSTLSGDGLAMAGNELNIADITPTFTLPVTAISPATFSSGTDPIFSLGTIVNAESDGNVEYVVIEFNAVVNNDANTNHGDVKSNQFQVQTGATPTTLVTSNSVEVTIREPVITQTKQLLSPTPRDAGDLATYRVTFTNTGGATAFETSLVDNLPGDLTLNVANVTITPSNGATGVANASSGNSVQVTVEAIPPGGSVTVTYAATVNNSIAPGQIVQNASLVTYTSLPGTNGTTSNPTGSATPGSPGQSTGERTGSGTASNDYRVWQSASFTAALPTAVKSIVATSEPSTSDANVAIGEIIRYRLLVRLPEGTTADLRLTEQLPNGLRFLNDATAKVALVADHVTRIASSTLAGPGLVAAGNDTTIGSITPTFVLPESAIQGGPFVSGTDPIFALGTITNWDNDLSTEFIVLEFNALVCNDAFAFNQNSLLNRALVQSGTTTLATSNPSSVTVREPVLVVTKTLDGSSPRQAGDLVNYRISYTNHGGATGFDVRLLDTLPPKVAVEQASIQITLSDGAAGITNASAGNTLDLTVATVPVGGSVTIAFTGQVQVAVTPAETIGNTASLTYTSLPGDRGTTINATGSSTPGNPGDPDGERTGSRVDRNRFFSASSVNFITPLVNAVKSIAATSEPSTNGSDVAIGEIVRYRLQAELPQGTHPFLQFRDNLPAGLQLLNDQTATVAFVATTGTGIASDAPALSGPGLLTTGNETNVSTLVPTFLLAPETIAAPDGTQNFGSGTDVILSLGTVVNANFDAFKEYVIVEFNALVNNNSFTNRDDVKANQFLVQIDPSRTTVGSSNIVAVTIREPRLELEKQILPPIPQAVGDTVRYEATFTNAGDAVAFDTLLTDDLPASLTLQRDSIHVSLRGGAAGAVNASSGNGVHVSVASVPVGGSVTVAYTAILNASESLGQAITDTAWATHTSLPGTNGTTSNPTLSATPGAGGSETGERNAQGGVNDYSVSAETSLPMADLRITKTDGQTTSIPGTSITYTIVVTNAGPVDVTGAAVKDPMTATLTGVTWTATQTGGASGFPTSGTGPIDHLVNLPNGSTITYTVTGNIAPAASGALTNLATILPPSNVADLDLGNNTATDVNTLVPTADLRIAKTNNTSTAVPGTATTYTIVVTNAGPSDVTGATINDPLPAILTGVSYTAIQTGGATGFTANGSGNINDTAVNLPVGSTLTYVTTGMVNPAARGTLSNTVTVTPPLGTADPIPGNNSATDNDPLTPTADLRITNTNHLTSIVPGTTTTYTIVVTNAGPSAASGATVNSLFPAALTGVTYTATQTGGATGFTAHGSGNIGDAAVNLPVGSTITYVVTGVVSPSATGTLSTTATVTTPAGTIDPMLGNNAATDSDPVNSTADLQITKTNHATSVVPGATTTYTVVVTNAGPAAVTGAAIRDAFPAILSDVTYTAAQTGGASGFTAHGSGNIDDPAVQLPVGSSITYVATGRVNPSATGTLSNTATVTLPAEMTDPTPDNNQATDTAPLAPTADLQITKTNHAASVVPGATTTYTIVVTNAGPSAVSGAAVSDPLPAALTGVSYTATQTGGASGFTANGSGNVNDAAVNLPVGSTVTYVVTGAINPWATGTLVNTATVTPPAGVTDPTPGNNAATDSDALTPTADLQITKTNLVASVVPGATTTYTIVVTNAGPSAVSGAAVSDPLPAALTGGSYTATQTGGASGFTANGSGNVNDAAVNLPVGSTVTYVVTGAVNPWATGTLVNTATVTPPAGVTDPTPGNNAATDSDALTLIADLQITKTNLVASVVPGTTTTYTIVVTNAGPSAVSGAAVSDPLPAALTGVSYTATQTGGASGFTANGSGNINDAAVNLPVGSTVTYVVMGAITPWATGTLVNTATVTPPAGMVDPTLGNNSATDSDGLIPTADLRITKTGHVTSVVPGTAMTYTIVVTNAGPSAVSGAAVSDPLPAALTGGRYTATQTGGASGFTANGSGNINDATVNLPVGSTVTYVVTGTINAWATGTLVNTATVTPPAGVVDPTPSNNSATASDGLVPTADLRITKTGHVTSVVPGTPMTYTIVVTNAGPSGVTGAAVSDPFPTALTGVSYTATQTGGATGFTANGSGNVNDTAVNLPAGSTITYVATGTVSPAATGTLINTAAVTPPAGLIDPAFGNNTATNIVALTPTADLRITNTNHVISVVPGTTTTYTIVVTNAGPSSVSGATVSDSFPTALSDVTFTATQTGGATGFTAVGSGSIRDETVHLPVGSTVTYVATGMVSPSATGTLVNTARVIPPPTVTDPMSGNNLATDADPLVPTADLQITKTNHASSVIPGTATTYTIVVTNAGPSTVTGASISDPFPAALTGVTYTATQTGGATGFTAGGSGNINDMAVNLPVGGTVTYTATGMVAPAAMGTLLNVATVASPAGVTDPAPGNNAATDSDPLRPTADLRITKTNHTSSVVLGARVTYTIVVSNAGPSAVTGATVSDVFPTGLTNVTYTSTVTGLASGNTAAGVGNILDTVNMAAGSTITYTASATFLQNGNGSLTNIATVTPPPGVEISHPENGEAQDSDSIQKLIVIAPDSGNASQPWIHLVSRETGALVARFLAFDESYRGGIRITTGDLTGDGMPEIVAVRGRNSTPDVRIFDLQGSLLQEISVFPATFDGGVHVAVGDVDGDGRNDLIAAMGYGGSQVVVFKNETADSALMFLETSRFYPLGSGFKGGAVVAAADMGKWEGSIFLASLDGKAEIVVGSAAGIRPTVHVFDYASLQVVRTFYPFTSTFQGGLSLDVACVNREDDIPDIIVGTGPGGGSKVEVLNGALGLKTTLLSFVAYTAAETSSYHAPVRVAAVDDDGDGFADVIVTAQGHDGTTGIIKAFRATEPVYVSEQFTGNLPVPSDFDNAYFVSELTIATPGGSEPAPDPSTFWTNSILAEDVNADGRVTALDALLVINDLNLSGARILTGIPPAGYFPDVNASGSIEPADVLRVIQYLNAPPSEAGGEGEFAGVPNLEPFHEQIASRFASLGSDIQPGNSIFRKISLWPDVRPASRATDLALVGLAYDAADPVARCSPTERTFRTATNASRDVHLGFAWDDDLSVIAEDVCRAGDLRGAYHAASKPACPP